MGGYIGSRSVVLSTTAANVQDVTATDTTPEVTIINNTHEDTDGGREGKVIFKGQQSGGEETTLAEIQGSHDGASDDEKGDLIFKTNDGSDGASPTEAMRIDALQNVGIGTAPSTDWRTTFDLTAAQVGLSGCLFNLDVSTGDRRCMMTSNAILNSSGDFQHILEGHATIYSQQSGTHRWYTAASASAGATASASERMRIDDSGNLLIGNTSTGLTSDGINLHSDGVLEVRRNISTASSSTVGYISRGSSDGNLLNFYRDTTQVGSIVFESNGFVIDGEANHAGIRFGASAFVPRKNGVNADNLLDCAAASVRFDDIFATNGTIQTSDENEKQNIASLTSAEITAATAISKLFKTYKWKDKVAAKGDNARTHTGVVAQQVQTAMADAGLDASKYAFWCSDTWWEKDVEVAAVEADEEKLIEAADAYTRTDTYDTQEEAPEGATERNRKGIRYPELLAFIGAATEQRLTSIEARLTALEAE